jgi:hypothetical protein
MTNENNIDIDDQETLDDQELIVIDYNDIIPTEEELTKFAIVFKNKDQIVRILGDEGTEEKTKSFNTLAESLGIDGDMLFSSLFIARLFYLANVDVEILDKEDLEENINVD